MSEENYNLDFDGYWRESKISGLPKASGIYAVYRCKYDSTNQTVNLKKLIYIGESGDINQRVANHEKWPVWAQELQNGEVICISATKISPSGSRERAEAAMINKHKPVCNTEFVNSFPYDKTNMNLTGKCALMTTNFSVYRS